MRSLSIIVLLVMDTAVAFAAPSFRVIASNSFVSGTLSADGSTVGISEASATGGARLYDVSERRTIASFGSEGSIAIVVSGDGSIAQIWNGQLSEYRDGIETPATNLPTFVPVALSDDGEISIGSSTGPNGIAYRKTGGIDGTTESLEDLAGGGIGSTSFALSGDGSIVVGIGTSGLGREAFRWADGTISGLGDLPGGAFESVARGISRDGSTIVGYGTSSLGREAFRFRNGVMEGLGNLPGGSSGSTALATSGDGAIVVGTANSLPFIWDEDHGMRDLRVVMMALGLDIESLEAQGLVIAGATDISSDGNTILGNGFDTLEGRAFLWLAIIPEPSTAILLGLGLAALAAHRRH